MLSHVTIAIADFDRARAFWLPVMTRLGFVESWHAPGRESAFRDPDLPRPLFFLSCPWEGAPHPGNGPMVGLAARDRATVDAVHAMALAAGATDEGAPGLRPRYHPDYYGAYFRDPDGNKIALACHTPDAGA